MKTQISKFSFCLFFILLLSQTNTAQTIGKIFSAEEADELFGKVLTSVNIEASTLQDLVEKTENVLMFGIFDSELVIAGEGRKVLYPEDYQLNDEDVMHVWTIDIITDLLDKGKQDVSTVEIRSEVMTITNGLYTLEISGWCPPICQDKLTSR